MTPAVFLDRDNTLIHNDGDLGDPSAVKLIQGAASAIASLRGLGYRIVVVTNQGGVARGLYTEEDVDKVHERINDLVRATSGATIDRFYYCPFHPDAKVDRYRGDHPWRKPRPGMLLQAAKDLGLDMGQSWLVGDQMRDVEAGIAAGVRTILLASNAEELSPLRLEEIAERKDELAQSGRMEGPHFMARSLIEAVRIIAQQRKPESPEDMRARDKTTKRWDPAAKTTRQGKASPETPASATPTPEPPPAVPASRVARQPVPTAFDQPARTPVTVVSSTPREDDAAGGEFSQDEDERQKRIAEALAFDEAVAGASVTKPTPIQVEPKLKTAPQQSETVVSQAAAIPATPTLSSGTDPAGLQELVRELRMHRAHADDFSWLRVAAIVLQMFALILFAGALMMGQAQIDSFLRWIGTAIFVQLLTVAVQLFDRR